MAGINIGTAFLQIVPSMQGVQGEMQRAGEQAGGIFSGGFGKILKAGAVIGAVKEIGEAAGAAFSATFGEAMERQQAQTNAAAQLGLSDADSKALGTTAGKLYAQAYGDSFGSVTDALATVKSSLKGLGADELEGATKRALSFSQAFEVDVSRAATVAGTVLNQGLAKDATNAFDLITRASQKVPADLREDVLDAAEEYGGYFHQIGLSGEQAFSALVAGAAKGQYGIDKTGDAIGEFTKLVGGKDSGAMEALTGLGLNAGEMATAIATGGDSAQTAMQQIVSALGKVQDPAAQAQTAISLFGTPLEDLGTDYVPQFVASMQDGASVLGDVAGAADEVDGKLGGTIQSKFTSLTRTLEGFGPTLSTAFFPIVGPVLDGLTGLATKAQESMQGAADNITGFFSGFNGTTDESLTDNQKRWAIWGDQVRGAVNGPFDTVMSYVTDFKGAMSTLFTGDFDPSQWFNAPMEDSALVDFLLTLRETVGDTFGQVFDTLGQVWQQIGPPLMEAFKTIWSAVQPLIPTFLDLFQAFNPVGLLFKALLPVLPQIAGVVGDLAKVLADGVARALKAVAPLFETVVGVINRLMPFVTRLVTSLLPPFVSLIDKLAPLLDAVLGALEPVVGALIDALIPAIDALMPTVERVFTFIADTVTNVMAVFGGVIDVLTGIFTGDWEKVWTGVKEIFGGIWDQIKNIFGTLWDVMVEFFTNLGPKLWEIVSGLAGQLVQWGGQFLGWIWQGIQDLWNGTIWPWFVGLPELVWSAISAAAGQLVDWGRQFLQWVWDGITAKFEEVKAWFSGGYDNPNSLLGGIWAAAQAAWQTVSQWGTDLIGWIRGGIDSAKDTVIQWFKDLPGLIWGAVQGLWASATEWGGQLMKYVVDGISGSDPYVSAAFAKTMMNAVSGIVPVETVAGLFNIDINKNIDDYITGLQRQATTLSPNYQSGGRNAPGRATGGLFGPYDGHAGGMINVGTHGTADDVLIRGSKTEFMVNAEDTRKNLPLLMHINAGGNPWELFPGFASGGLIGGLGRLAGGMMVKAILPTILSALTDGMKNSTVASNGQWGPATDGSGLAANTQAARDFIMSKWGISNIGGVYGGSVPGSDHPIGKALDVMIANYLSAAGIAQGTSVADWFVQNPNAFGTKYVIWRDRINQGGSWAPYQHPSGSNDTLQHRDHVHLSFLTGSGQFNGGAQAAADDQPSGFLGQLVSHLVGGFTSKLGGLAPAAPTGSGVEQWRSMALQALTAVGNFLGRPLTQHIDRMLYQMQTESGGDPNALNTWDRNYPLYGGSKGLLQTIQPTFETALRGTPWENLIPKGPFDPWANMLASIMYGEVTGPYHSLERAYRGVAYDHGGMQYPGDIGFNFLTKPEAVLTPPETEAYQAHARALAAGFDSFEPKGGFTFTGDIHMGSGGPAEFFDEALWRARTSA